ncbi:hypothetical protein GmHk_03G006881 [Glycine max]|nr:hypothetical protein GmHk_03G006881 [Glycine max]
MFFNAMIFLVKRLGHPMNRAKRAQVGLTKQKRKEIYRLLITLNQRHRPLTGLSRASSPLGNRDGMVARNLAALEGTPLLLRPLLPRTPFRHW